MRSDVDTIGHDPMPIPNGFLRLILTKHGNSAFVQNLFILIKYYTHSIVILSKIYKPYKS
jgi:hypothetical protein